MRGLCNFGSNCCTPLTAHSQSHTWVRGVGLTPSHLGAGTRGQSLWLCLWVVAMWVCLPTHTAQPWPRPSLPPLALPAPHHHLAWQPSLISHLAPALQPGPSASHLPPGPSASQLQPGPSASHLLA